MRELYNEFFYIPKHGKIREKVMLTRIVTTITIVIMCLAAISITAYAYFSYNVTSGLNTIKAASFYTDVTVQITAQDGTAVETITTNTSNHISHSAELTANKTYTVTVKHNALSTAKTGFVIVTAEGCTTEYHTQQLGRDGDGNAYTITFKLTPGANTVVTIFSHWGTSSYYGYAGYPDNNIEEYILDGETVELIIGGSKPSSGDEGNGDDADTPGDTSEGTTVGESSASTADTITPTTETTPSTDSTTSETTVTEQPATTTETATESTKPAATESAETAESTETQPTEETTGVPTTEVSE